MTGRLRQWAASARREVLVLYLAARDPRVPWYAKVLATLTAAYALSPIDLIPDFIPVLGYLDDLLIIPAAILLTVRLIPAPVVSALRSEAERRFADARPVSAAGAVIVVGSWLVVAGLVAALVLWPR